MGDIEKLAESVASLQHRLRHAVTSAGIAIAVFRLPATQTHFD